MVNIWGTTCGPCVQEMPELEEYYKEIAKKGGNIIGNPILGANVKKYKETMDKLLSEAE